MVDFGPASTLLQIAKLQKMTRQTAGADKRLLKAKRSEAQQKQKQQQQHAHRNATQRAGQGLAHRDFDLSLVQSGRPEVNRSDAQGHRAEDDKKKRHACSDWSSFLSEIRVMFGDGAGIHDGRGIGYTGPMMHRQQQQQTKKAPMHDIATERKKESTPHRAPRPASAIS